jgi:hypothetical protein
MRSQPSRAELNARLIAARNNYHHALRLASHAEQTGSELNADMGRAARAYREALRNFVRTFAQRATRRRLYARRLVVGPYVTP